MSNSFVDMCQESVNTGDAPKGGQDTLGHEKARLWPGEVSVQDKTAQNQNFLGGMGLEARWRRVKVWQRERPGSCLRKVA